MKYAIDRYSVGFEKEVIADDFDNDYYIPRRTSRFYCPECNELVYFRASGGGRTSHFYHQEKTERSPECDKRVDGRSSLSLSERVGLPLYLIPLFSKKYQLCMGFPALGSYLFNKAIRTNCSVTISGGERSRSVLINETNFIEDGLSLIPINFIPKNKKNYVISINSEYPVFDLQRKWADYADGFDYYGAIFNYDESGGKKIRSGDSISTNRKYYAVTKNDLPEYGEIQREEVGVLEIGKDRYKVLLFSVNVSIENSQAFSSINSFFKRAFGVWLLECLPELVPLWPPIIQQDYLIPVKTYNPSVTCAVSSGNAEPSVYTYSSRGVSKKRINKSLSGFSTVDFFVGEDPVTLSVDRKYVGREISFQKREIGASDYTYEVNVQNVAGEIVSWEALTPHVFSSPFSIISNSKMELYTGTKSKVFRHFSIRDKETPVPAMDDIDEMFLVVGESIIYQFYVEKPAQSNKDTQEIIELIKDARKGQRVPVPWWINTILCKVKKNHNETVYDEILSSIYSGEIHIGLLRLLRNMELNGTFKER